MGNGCQKAAARDSVDKTYFWLKINFSDMVICLYGGEILSLELITYKFRTYSGLSK